MIRLEVEWLDSGIITTSEMGWASREKILEQLKLVKVTTVGVKFGEDDEALYIALSVDPVNKQYFGVQAIAKSCIRKITLLRARRELPDLSSAGNVKIFETSLVDIDREENAGVPEVLPIDDPESLVVMRDELDQDIAPHPWLAPKLKFSKESKNA